MRTLTSSTFRIVVAVLVLFTAGYYWLLQQLTEQLERQYFEAAEEPMVDAANLMAGVAGALMAGESGPAPNDADRFDRFTEGIEDGRSRVLHSQIYDLIKTEVGMEVYVTDATGALLYDSGGRFEVGEDMSERRDVARTLRGEYGARSTRTDEDDDRSSVMFVGAPIRAPDGTIIGALSISKPQSAMFQFIAETRERILRSAVLSGLAVAAGALAAGLWFSRPLRKLTGYAQAVRRGERPTMPHLSGTEARTLGLALDEMREALEGRKYVESYVQTLTHEMKSPVTAIRGAAELLQDPDMPPDRRQRFLGNIQQESDRLHRRIDRLLALSAIEGQTSLRAAEEVDLTCLVDDACSENRSSADARSITLAAETSPVLSVRGDPFILRAAVSNLLANAIDFSPDGGRVSIDASPDPDDPDMILIAVTDEGTGVPDFARDRVFERFYSLPHPATGRKSSGLGLCFVREAAALHGGTATLENRSDPSAGCRAVIRLPRMDP